MDDITSPHTREIAYLKPELDVVADSTFVLVELLQVQDLKLTTLAFTKPRKLPEMI